MTSSINSISSKTTSNSEQDFTKMVGSVKTSALQTKMGISIIYNSSAPAIKTFHDYVTVQTRSESGFALSFVTPSREAVKQLEMIMIKEAFEKNLDSQDKIIEIGAGKLDESGQSYLMTRLPAELRKCVEPTDVNRTFLENHKQEDTLKHVDSIELDKSYAKESLGAIIGSAVLDTLNQKDLIATLEKAHVVLKEQGKLIHISSLNPLYDVLISTYTNENTIVFPLVSEEKKLQGLQIISKDSLMKFINAKENDAHLKFLTWYTVLPHSERELMLNALLYSNMEVLAILSNWIKEMNPEGLTTIENDEFFQNRMKEALKKAGFKILEFGYRKASHIIKRPKDFLEKYKDHNYFEMDHKLYKKNCYVLPLDCIYQDVNMFIIVAEKISSHLKNNSFNEWDENKKQ